MFSVKYIYHIFNTLVKNKHAILSVNLRTFAPQKSSCFNQLVVRLTGVTEVDRSVARNG